MMVTAYPLGLNDQIKGFGNISDTNISNKKRFKKVNHRLYDDGWPFYDSRIYVSYLFTSANGRL